MARMMIQLKGIFLFLIAVQILNAQSEKKEAVWVTTKAEIPVVNMTTDEARIQLLRMARQNAIEQVCGISLQSETLVKDFTTAGDFIYAIACGEIAGEKNVNWSTENRSSQNPGTPPLIIMRVSMEVQVKKSDTRPDPYFKIKMESNESVFHAGDELEIKVSSTQDCYLTVLDLAADDTVYVLFPNCLREEVFVKANTPLTLPDEPLKEMGFHLRVHPLPGTEKSTEIIKVIATKQRLPIFEMMNLKTGIGKLGTPRAAVQQLIRALSEIPMDQRAEATKMISILAKK